MDLEYLRLAFSGAIASGKVAHRAGVTPSTMSAILRGSQVPSHKIVARLARIASSTPEEVWTLAEAAIQRKIAAEKAQAADAAAAKGGAP